MTSIKEDIKCPNCKKKNRVKIIEECNKEHIESIIDRSFFSVKCKDCNETITIDHPITIKTDKYLIYYTPTSDKTIKDKTKIDVKRVCDTYDDLKEKLLILEDDLNDVLIEFIKSFYKMKIDDEVRKDLKEIRYNCKLEDQLVFSLVGTNKSIGCPLFFYNDLLKNSRIKKIKYAELVDEHTYKKYYRMKGLL